MKLSRFLIGLALLALVLVASKFATDPFASSDSSNIAATLGLAVGVVSGGLILGLIIWAPIRLACGAERTPDIRGFALYTAVITAR